ncbi:carbohydrate porin [Cyanobacterium stanieri LEGE 03274]|uniref:Carbohydrate porin n=1 Tax=Cyanobacterium stanieri LEGE 03274 TaxID=1828756 RepID=A0ABR9V5V0_9CHRO|nr:iron uptake porin [Cyanobacterium stanieri]MBE9223272.1 carbohydrate porin [Cyanobacterium stanieri LEGE 03274]
MSKISWKNLGAIALASSLTIIMGEEAKSNEIILSGNNQNSVDFLSSSDNQLGQVTSVNQLSDVSPTDWAYEALRSLVERYGCIVGYPDRTFRGNRALSRYEFAAGLNACMQSIERLIGTGGVSEEDIAALRRLISEFETELAALGARVDNLEGRVAFLEDHQFSTTTKLSGEVIFTLANAFNNNPDSFQGSGVDRDQTMFANRVRLNFDTSFTGRDRLRVRLQAGNFERFGNSNMLRLGHDAGGGNNVEIDDIYYRFPVGDSITGYVGTSAMDIDNIFEIHNPYLESGSTGSLTRFLRRDPLTLRGPEGVGGGASIQLSDSLTFNALYLATDGNNPEDGNGLFNGGYSAGGQLSFTPSDNFALALAYLRTYEPENSVNIGSSTSTSNTTNPFGGRPTSADRFGVQANFRFSPRVNLAASGGYVSAENLDPFGIIGVDNTARSDADLWTWAANLSFVDVGKEGAVLSLGGGMPPRSEFERDTSYIVELQYRYPISRNVTITPGLFAVFNPNHDSRNDTVYVGAVRTTFKF